MMMCKARRAAGILFATSLAVAGQTLRAAEDEAPQFGGDLWSRPRLTGDWGGARDQLAAKGLTFDVDLTYIFQGVTSGGPEGAAFDQLSDEDDVGNTIGGDFRFGLDTRRAGWWQGGSLAFRAQARAGQSVVQRAGTVSPVNTAATLPNVVDDFDDPTFAITELSYTQYFGETFALFGGLLNTAEGDENALAGSALSNSHFLNSAMLYSLVEDATVPNVSLGGGFLFEPNDRVSGSFSVFATAETAGEDPFDEMHGTTFSTEWTIAHTLRERPGAQTFGLLYGIDANRTDIAADPRVVLSNILAGGAVPETNDDTWAFYYNAHQYLVGDEEGGWGLFCRFGLSDGNPNPVKWNAAAGFAGLGLIPSRANDNWALGLFYVGVSDEDLLSGLNVDDEFGGEIYYNIAISPWIHVTLDAQVIDSALPGADTVVVLGVRTHLNF